MEKHNEFQFINSNIPEDLFSKYLEECFFEFHAFGHEIRNAKNVCDYRVVGDFELIFVVGGQSIITIGHREYRLSGGDIMLIPPFTRHKIQTPQEDPHDNYWIHFDVLPVYKQNEWEALIWKGICNCSKEQFYQVILPLLVQMEREKKTCRYGSKRCMELLFQQLVISLVREQCEETIRSGYKPVSRAEMDIVERGMQFIMDSVECPVKIKDICAHLHISESYLHKTFAKVIGLSPNYLIQLCKVKRAEQLLKTTSYSVKEISQLLRFSSQYYFSTVFKSFYGVSPRGYVSEQEGGIRE